MLLEEANARVEEKEFLIEEEGGELALWPPVVRELNLCKDGERGLGAGQGLLVELVGLEEEVVVMPVSLRPASPSQGDVQQVLGVVERSLKRPGEHNLMHLHLLQCTNW